MYSYVTSAKKLGSVYYVHNHYIMTIEMLIHEIEFTFFYKLISQFDFRDKWDFDKTLFQVPLW